MDSEDILARIMADHDEPLPEEVERSDEIAAVIVSNYISERLCARPIDETLGKFNYKTGNLHIGTVNYIGTILRMDGIFISDKEVFHTNGTIRTLQTDSPPHVVFHYVFQRPHEDAVRIWKSARVHIISPFPTDYELRFIATLAGCNYDRRLEVQLELTNFQERLTEARERARLVKLAALPAVPPRFNPRGKTKAAKSKAAERNMA